MKFGPEFVNEAVLIQEGSCVGSILREAALKKFRMKRKDRYFEKKVRYESRKKLAEQCPRVKGQFMKKVFTLKGRSGYRRGLFHGGVVFHVGSVFTEDDPLEEVE